MCQSLDLTAIPADGTNSGICSTQCYFNSDPALKVRQRQPLLTSEIPTDYEIACKRLSKHESFTPCRMLNDFSYEVSLGRTQPQAKP
ncbi:unnamed protein product [Bursaphelenchus xylophilus]|uniref:(pine wood nematode) hypothetical protein n=1 Tax=Bursaphelenchus xylophilus TaxID=6326 RepID=A0A7I8XM32_BURXY|nr:unnamed protein product [Bursaphelenchus xylophilus]CAG9121719.1 unnamed protein product [Bursaphelenchus xylophilus]